MRVELENVTVEMQGRRVLDGVSLSLEPGRALGVLGESGSGVSLLLKTAAGLLDPTRGRVLYDGADLARMDEEERRLLQTRTGFLFQDAALWANTDLLGNLVLPLQARSPDEDVDALRRRAREAAAELGFDQDLRLRPDRLSFGQRRFVSFLRAVLPGPETLFLDEPYTGMDDRWIEVVERKARELRARGASLMMGGHHRGGWCDLADRLVGLERGRIVPMETSEEETSP